MKLKKLLASILALCMVLSTIGTVAFANNTEADVWDGTVDTSWYNETDTEFELSTAAQLAGLAELVDGGNTFKEKTIYLCADITLNPSIHFNPIGHSKNGNSFNGTFDGQGNTIFDLYQQSNLDSNNGGWLYEGEYYGLFAYTNGATIMNLTIDGAYVSSGRNEAAGVVGNANNTTFSDITISNTTLIVYNNTAGGVAAECYGTCSLTNIVVDENTVVGPLWGTYDAVLGGVVGQVKKDDNVSFENVTVACRIDGINDVASNNQWWLYRRSGMLIGNVDAVIDGFANPQDYVTCKNVEVTIGTWANYHYCEFETLGQGSYNGPDEWKFARVEAGTGTDGIDLSTCNHKEYESHNVLIPFNQLFGGNTGVKGLTEFDGVTITDDAKAEREVVALYRYDDAAHAERIYVDTFTSLQEAIDYVGTDEGEYELVLLKDIEEDVEIKQYPNQKITITGDADNKPVISGTIKINGRSKQDATAALTIENIVFDAAGAEEASINASWDNNSRYTVNVTISNCDFIDEEATKLIAAIKTHTGGDINWLVEDCTATGLHSFIQVANIEKGFVVKDCVVTDCKNGINLNNTEGFTMTGTKINADGYGIRTGAGKASDTPISITLEDNEINVKALEKDDAAIVLRSGANGADVAITSGTYVSGNGRDVILKESAGSKIALYGGFYSSNVSAYVADGFDIARTANGYTVEPESAQADKISIVYEDVTETGVEGEKTYAIVVKANEGDVINELASVDLSFVFTEAPVTGGDITFTVLPADKFSLTEHDSTVRKELTKRYMFNYNGVGNNYEGTDNAITVGTITVTGYGKFTIATAGVATNVVNATTVNDNLVDSYIAADTTDGNERTGVLDISGKVDNGDIPVPTRKLTITVDFPNEVIDQVKEYQDMKVEITGTFNDGKTKTVPYALGGNMVNGSYVVEDANLVLDNAYTVTVSGAGYRTARYTVTMTEEKALRFWNNVMDEAQFVEIGKESSKVNVTFLAGDIVKDNNINIYDLSAVVSYFGTEDCVNKYPEYAKYDLNRDGVIDSKDVAYVLVSWNN